MKKGSLGSGVITMSCLMWVLPTGKKEMMRIGKRKKGKDYGFPMLTAVADSGTLDRYCCEVSKWDGVVRERTLRWLRSIVQLPESLQMTIAW